VIDLHTHSTCSDGTDPPGRIVELAAAAGCSAVALTDHDTFAGLPRAQARARSLGIELVPGCEVSCAYRGGNAHLLVYFVEEGNGPLDEELARLREDRVARNRRLVLRLQELGMPITYDEVVAEAAGEESVGRPHVAAVMTRKGIVETIPDAFDSWLGEGRLAYVPKIRVHPREIAAAAAVSGGVVSLAHPLTLGDDPEALESAVAELAGAGLVGLESYYGRYTPEERERLAALARRHDLVPTGGSDYHGGVKPDLAVGLGLGDLQVPDGLLEELNARRP
jgi:3',5'-nucleoside bisphosphate phosphatase